MDIKKRHNITLICAAIVIVANFISTHVGNTVLTVAVIGVDVLVLYVLLRMDKRFNKVFMQVRTASSLQKYPRKKETK